MTQRGCDHGCSRDAAGNCIGYHCPRCGYPCGVQGHECDTSQEKGSDVASATISWHRVQRGWYEATDPSGDRWRIIQHGSQHWQAARSNGTLYLNDGPRWYSLAEAKSHVESGGMFGHAVRQHARERHVPGWSRMTGFPTDLDR